MSPSHARHRPARRPAPRPPAIGARCIVRAPGWSIDGVEAEVLYRYRRDGEDLAAIRAEGWPELAIPARCLESKGG